MISFSCFFCAAAAALAALPTCTSAACFASPTCLTAHVSASATRACSLSICCCKSTSAASFSSFDDQRRTASARTPASCSSSILNLSLAISNAILDVSWSRISCCGLTMPKSRSPGACSHRGLFKFVNGMAIGELNIGAIIGTIIDGVNGISGFGGGVTGVLETAWNVDGDREGSVRSRALGQHRVSGRAPSGSGALRVVKTSCWSARRARREAHGLMEEAGNGMAHMAPTAFVG